eukprot:365773-Chlamydomonas_euryale.AAC.7
MYTAAPSAAAIPAAAAGRGAVQGRVWGGAHACRMRSEMPRRHVWGAILSWGASSERMHMVYRQIVVRNGSTSVQGQAQQGLAAVPPCSRRSTLDLDQACKRCLPR